MKSDFHDYMKYLQWKRKKELNFSNPLEVKLQVISQVKPRPSAECYCSPTELIPFHFCHGNLMERRKAAGTFFSATSRESTILSPHSVLHKEHSMWTWPDIFHSWGSESSCPASALWSPHALPFQPDCTIVFNEVTHILSVLQLNQLRVITNKQKAGKRSSSI